MSIRTAEAADAQGIAEVHVRAWQIAYRDYISREYLEALSVRTSTMRWLASLADPMQTDALVAEDAGRIVGWSAFGMNRNGLGIEVGEVFGLYVDPDAWNRGIGTALLAESETRLGQTGFGSAILWTLEANRRTRRFYEARGWNDDGISESHPSGAIVVRYSRVLGGRVDPDLRLE
jgi:GNAT superfamily N-acetyltransferase